MTLKEWFENNREFITMTDVADLTGIKVSSLYNYSRRVVDPPLTAALKLFHVTRGMVTLREMTKHKVIEIMPQSYTESGMAQDTEKNTISSKQKTVTPVVLKTA